MRRSSRIAEKKKRVSEEDAEASVEEMSEVEDSVNKERPVGEDRGKKKKSRRNIHPLALALQEPTLVIPAESTENNTSMICYLQCIDCLKWERMQVENDSSGKQWPQLPHHCGCV